MNILFVTRLYSGFEASLSKLEWNPEGVPTIYNLFNKLSLKHNLSIIFTAKDSGATYTSSWQENKDMDVKLKNLKADIKVLCGTKYFFSFIPRKLAMIMRDIRQFIKIVFYVIKIKPDLVYCDSANVVIAFLLTKIFPSKPIVVRVLGICSFWRSITNSRRIVHRIYKFSYKGKFSAVIGTQDGSGIEYWFKETLLRDVPRYVLLNGVDSLQKTNKTNITNKTILFVGRLEEYKGILNFINAIIAILKEKKHILNIVIVGDGTLYNQAINLCKNSGFFDKFKFLKSIPHQDVLNEHIKSDIYVSANTDGNLINTNLEAISSNACMVIPKPQSEKLIDIETYKLLGNAVVYYKVNDVNDLENKILYLLNNPNKITYFKNKISSAKLKFIKTWDQRVDEEENILKNIIKNN
ncbi:MAG: glycosyltransferase [Pelagibacterales bacterium]|jgi:glycosyltransferase involved in cell wall biosynthesis|nr:glycosyltransferase [Pelagibacterales bacterium]